MTATPEQLTRVADLVKDSRVGVLTTISREGQLVSRPLATQEVEFDGDLWFFSQDPSPKTDEIAANPEVNVSFASKSGYLSIAGTAEVVHDRAKITELWTPGISAWFPEGKDDPTVALIKVHAETAEYWALDEPRVVTLFKIARATITGTEPDIGENETVTL